MPKKPAKRISERVSIYLLPNKEQDSIVLDVYNASKVHDRVQDLFRAAIFRGLRSMFETGDIPEVILAHHRLAERLGRRVARQAMLAPPIPALPPSNYLPDPILPPPTQLSEAEFEARAPRAEEADPEPEDFLGLMGGAKPMTREDA